MRDVNPWLDAVASGLVMGLAPLPLAAARALGGGLGRTMSLLGGSRKAGRAGENLRRAGVADTARACRRGWACTGRTALEMLWMLSRPPSELLRDSSVQGLDALAAPLSRRQGVLLVSAHTGNWEIVPVAAAATGARIAVVARTLSTPRLERRIVSWRRAGGVSTLVRGAEGTSVAGYRTLSRGGVLGCMMDRASSGPRIPTPFLGGCTNVPAGPLLLARRTGAAIVLGTSRLRRRQVEIRFRSVPCLSTEEPGTVAAAIMKTVEDAFEGHPEEWLWIHRRQPRPEAAQ